MGGDASQKLLPRRGRSFPSGARYTSGVRSNQLYRKCLTTSARPTPPTDLLWQGLTGRLGHFCLAGAG